MNTENQEQKNIVAVTYIEEVEAQDAPIAANAVLTDEALSMGGLVKVEAFIRTKSSAAAIRKAKQREQQADAGLKQANIVAPVETLEPLKAIAKACAAGKSIDEAIKMVIPNVTSHGLVTKTVEIINPETERLANIGRKVEALSGWKKKICKLIGLI